jgi:alpha-L-rhamnosidase
VKNADGIFFQTLVGQTKMNKIIPFNNGLDKIAWRIACWTFLLLYASLAHAKSKLAVETLRCEYLPNPLGIDKSNPRFSWVLRSNQRNARQAAYLVIVSKNDPLFSQKNRVWESGEVVLPTSVNVSYEGIKLTSQTTYYWKVRVVDQTGTKSEWSKTQQFHTGLLGDDRFKAKWIHSPEASNRSPLFRKSFRLKKEILSAHVYASAIGLYELYLNGRKADGRLFEPAITQFSERVLYSVYDVTKQLSRGNNALGVWLGEGAGAFTRPPEGRFANINMRADLFPQPMLLLELKIRYKDGTEDRIGTDESWACSASPITFNNFFGGENYDARLEKIGWNTVSYTDADWRKSVVTTYPGKLSAQLLPPVLEGRIIAPVTTVQRSPTVIEYDFGVTIGGYWQVELEGREGESVTIRGTEKCGANQHQKPLSAENQLNWVGAHNKRYYYRDCYSQYTLNGNRHETYKPRFFYQGFRYLQLTLTDPNIKIKRVSVIETGHFQDPQSKFSSSSPYLNQLHGMIVQTLKNNFNQGVPLSNPNSEKYGWTGDVHLFAETADYSFFLPAFWTKWIRDFSDAQQWAGTSGLIPETVPELRKIAPKTDLSWTAAYPFLVRQMARHYQDTALVQSHYKSLTMWYKHVLGQTENLIAKGTYGDHLIPSITRQASYATPNLIRLINTAYLYRVVQVMAQLSEMVQQPDSAAYYRETGRNISQVFNHTFYNPAKKIYEEKPAPTGYTYELTANLISLQMGLVPEDLKTGILQAVKAQIQASGNKSFTGILGTKALVDVGLSEDPALLYAVIRNREFPGWGYFIDELGATTLNQNWDGAGDFNHCMFGSVDAFFFQGLAGIRLSDEAVVPTVIIAPFLPADLSEVSAHVPSLWGDIVSVWKKMGNGVSYTIRIPPNMEADFFFDVHQEQYKLYIDNMLIVNNDKPMNLPKWLHYTCLTGRKKSLRLGSGSYAIRIINNN